MSGVRRAAAERGGAYLLALTALLVLTGVGIVLSGIALVERRLGSADQDRLQALNAAESGLALATARLLSGGGEGELEVVFGARRSAGLARASRVRVEAPRFVGAAPCESCDPSGGAVGRVSYALTALGERIVWRPSLSPEAPRSVARVSVAATLTLQPWPVPGSARPVPEVGRPAPGCGPQVRARLLERLARELNPPACRYAPGVFAVRSRDAESGAVCTVGVPVCALLTDWRER